MNNVMSGSFQHPDPEADAERAARKAAYQAVNDILAPYADMEGATTARAIRKRLQEVDELCDLVDSIVKHPDVWNVAWADSLHREHEQRLSAAKRLLRLTDAPAIAWTDATGGFEHPAIPLTVTVRRESADGE